MLFRSAAVILAVALFASAGFGAEPGRVILSGHVPAVVSALAPKGRVPATNTLSLAIGLPLRNAGELDELLDQLYDPRSTNFHKFLTPAEFTARFGPTEEDYESVIHFAESNGLTVAGRHGSRVVLDVTGSTTNIEQAFGVTLRIYRHPTEARDFFAPDTEPSVPANLPVADLWGLTDFGPPRPQIHKVETPKITPSNYNGSGPSGSYECSDFRNAYAPGCGLTGKGQTAAVAEFDGYYAGDIQTYENNCHTPNVTLTNILLDGVSGKPGYSGAANAVAEVSLDIEMLVAMAPGLSAVRVYEGSSPYDVFDQIATDDLAKQISCSWTWSTGPTHVWNRKGTLDSLLEEMGTQGQSFFQASGDSDAYTGSGALSTSTGPIPADSIYVTSVGGTSLTMTGGGGSWASETVWNWAALGGSDADVGSSGGISAYYSIPSWQSPVSMASNGGSTVRRNIPDVALTADAVYVIEDTNVDGIYGGTSCAAPLWAGFCALVNQQSVGAGAAPVGFLNPALYTIGTGTNYTSCFHDITVSNNIGTHTAGLYYATNGYDLCTGWGTPNGTNLINALAPRPYFLTQPASQAAPTGSDVTFSVTVSGQPTFSYRWLFDGTNLTAGGNVSGTGSNVLTLTAVTTNEIGSYSVVVTNAYGSTTSSVATLTVGLPPAITNQPTNVTVLEGGSAGFSVGATGSSPLAYQWYFNATNALAGAVNPSLTIANAQAPNAGSYSVVVTNAYGSITSSVATLTVDLPPAIANQPTNMTVLAGGNAVFTVGATGTSPLSYQWYFNATNALAGAVNPSLTVANAQPPNAGAYSVVVTNAYGAITSSVATLTVGLPPAVTNPPASVAVLAGSNAVFTVGATGTSPLAYQWYFNATNLLAGAVSPSLTVANAQPAKAGGYSVVVTNAYGSTTSSVATLTVNLPPAITNQPASLTVLAGSNAVFSVGASGSSPLAYQWYFNTTNALAGTDSNVLTLTAVTTNDSGGYSVVVTNAYGSTTSSVATLTVGVPPAIMNQPTNLTVLAGGNAVFSVGATGSSPLAYQWYFNTTNALAGAVNPSLTVANAQPPDAGNYSIVVTNAYGSITSSVATLTVGVPPAIANQPTNLNLVAGSDAVFTVGATGSSPLVYQWYFNATNVLVGAINPSLSVANAQPPNAGAYSVVVTNAYGSTTSSVATLIVGLPPAITNQPTNVTVLAGSNAVFSVGATGSSPLLYQWYFNATNALAGADSNVLTLTAVTTNDSGNYDVVVTNTYGSATSAVAVLSVTLPPMITVGLTNQTVECGSNALFTITATGTPPLSYQWSLDNAVIFGATNNCLALTNVHPPVHLVAVVVTNLYGVESNGVSLTVQDTLPPVITLNGPNPFYLQLGVAFVDPGATAYDACVGAVPVTVSGAVNTGVVGSNTLYYTADDGNGNTNTVTRAVIVQDTTPPTIVSSFTNLTLAADTNCSAVMPDLTDTNFIVATDIAQPLTVTQSPTNGAILSLGTNWVVLTVVDAYGNTAYSTNSVLVQDQTPPVILTQPQSQTNGSGSTVVFSVAASACTPLSYQWSFNSAPLSDQTNDDLALSNLTSGVAGNYWVVATAAGGSTTSAVATLTVTEPVSSSVALDSSENPSGYKDSMDFVAAVLPATATGTVQFLTNGTTFDVEPVLAGAALSTNVSTLPRGTNLIAAVYSGDLNDLPATNTLAQIVTNHPPVAAPAYYTRQAGYPLSIAVTDLATNWSDADGDTVTLAGIGASTNGVTVTNNAGTLVYFDANNVDDEFDCTITDGWGGTNFQAVYITISLTNTAPNIISVAGTTNGVALSLGGAPGYTYVLQSATNLAAPIEWSPVATNTLGTNGLWQFTDTEATNFSYRFYRLMLSQ